LRLFFVYRFLLFAFRFREEALMAMVNALRFNQHCGAIISDAEYWNIRFRRRLYLDNLHALLEPEIADHLGMEVCYGGAGYPSLHHEVVTATRDELSKRYNESVKGKKKSPCPFRTVRDVGRIALECAQKVIRRRIDERLQFYFGFDSGDVLKGSFELDGKKYDIKQDAVKNKALAMATLKDKDRLMGMLFKSRACVFGYDASVGITAYYLDPENSFLAYNHEGFEAIGSGKYASGVSFGDFLGRKTLAMRKKGYEPAEGMFELIKSAITAEDHFSEVGGNMNIVYVDSKGKDRSERYREIFDETAKLAYEIVRAADAGLLGRKAAVELLDELIFRGATLEATEKRLFESVPDAKALELALRNYKLDEVAEMTGEKAQPAPAKTKPAKARK
jgi:hypothetical protein